ncbi:hypothetical protein PIB30_034967 [Stylosanthes scabra]|uniref:Uncharacterized protein n=1 Tax=Stylosanthes scabra TaxID=79078 RepID=A0ABU6ZC31_9FABA|nr:hypothetical protein [Stylosanthes scabra]
MHLRVTVTHEGQPTLSPWSASSPRRKETTMTVETPSDSSGVMETKKRRTTIRVDGAAAVLSEWSEPAEMVVAQRPPQEPPDLNLKTVVTGEETQRKTDPCLKTMLEALPCTIDGKAELHGAGNATDLSPVMVVLGETATVEMFELARYRSMDVGGEHDTSNNSAEDGAVAAERQRTLAARTSVKSVGEGATSMLGG